MTSRQIIGSLNGEWKTEDSILLVWMFAKLIKRLLTLIHAESASTFKTKGLINHFHLFGRRGQPQLKLDIQISILTAASTLETFEKVGHLRIFEKNVHIFLLYPFLLQKNV